MTSKRSCIFFTVFLIALTTSRYGFSQTASYDEVVSKKKKGNISICFAKNSEKFSVGDTLTLGSAFRNEQFDYIEQNAGIALYPLPNTASGSVVVIKKISARSKTVIVSTTRPQGFVYALRVTNLEGALTNGEVKSNVLSSDEALEELKKWKDKLDLELITAEEYEAKKTELAGYIK